jgi:hypothetical protein
MSRTPTFLLRLFVSLSLVIAARPLFAVDAELESAFTQPPADSRPRCYWYWLDGYVSKEGITKDLEAMRDVGIGGAYIGIIGGQSGQPHNPQAPADLSDAWWDLIIHAVREGTRTGVNIGLFNGPGWSQSGGPWVKPEESMRYLAHSEIRVAGPKKIREKLPAPQGSFQQVAVLAYPAPEGDATAMPIRAREKNAVHFESAEPFTARSLTLHPARAMGALAELYASDDGKDFRLIKKFEALRHNQMLGVGPVALAPVTVTFPAVTARYFRLDIRQNPATPNGTQPVGWGSFPLDFSADQCLREVVISPAARIDAWADKSLLKMYQGPVPPHDYYSWPQSEEPENGRFALGSNQIINLTSKVAADGTLEWDVPAGEWIIQRSGMLPTQVTNVPATPATTGLEVDKMSRSALKAHFNAYIGEVLRRTTPAERKSFTHVIADSYETGPQNWTDGFEKEFQQHYGYDPLPFLPALTGRVVQSAAASDRFLWDLRRLVAEKIARDYVGGLRELCHQNGLKLWLENYGHWGFPSEFLYYGGQSDEIGGEFWVGQTVKNGEIRAASSAAHIYGLRDVWAEAYTGGPNMRSTPRDLKAQGDESFCEGVTQFVLHVNIHQPDNTKRPGMAAWFGTEFNRHNTWFRESKAWIDYLRRSTVLLREGYSAADVAYFIGEDAPKMKGMRQPEIPTGYDWDFVNSDIILNRFQVKDRKLVLPVGTSYHVLVLPDYRTMRPEVLTKIAEFVAAGVTVVGKPPERSPSQQNQPVADERVKQLVGSLWESGKIAPVDDLAAMLTRLNVSPAVEAPLGIGWKHRRSANSDIYFVCNPTNSVRTVTVSFRDHRPHASLWHADSGRMEFAKHRTEKSRAILDLTLDPSGSVFVVFSDQAAANAVPNVAKKPVRPSGTLEITRAAYEALSGVGGGDVTEYVRAAISDGRLEISANPDVLGGDPAYGHVKQLKIEYVFNGKPATATTTDGGNIVLPPPPEVPGPWKVEFPSRAVTFEKLISWTDHQEPDIKFHSGSATYWTKFSLSDAKSPIQLDLGQVEALATVTVNGKEFPTLWKYPYQLDIASALRQGTNELKIRVTNAWNNRLVGDAQLPQEQRISWSSSNQIGAGHSLLPAGLLGPVTLRKFK